MIRTYQELRSIKTFEERYHYLSLRGEVGKSTFGFDRHINQRFYRSTEWKNIRNHVITRDLGCDLGIEDREIHSDLLIHHMNPMTVDDIVDGDPAIINPDFLITTCQRTHNAIHYGEERLLVKDYAPRIPGDTKLW